MKELPVAPAGPQAINPGKENIIVGIDLGTTNSLVAYVENGTPRIIPSREGRNAVPSAVHFLSSGEVEIGYAARKYRVRDAKHTVYSVKRLLGRGIKDLQGLVDRLPFNLEESSSSNVLLKIDGKTFTPIQISAMILRELKLAAEEHLGCPIENAVVTVPAYFNDSQRQATRAAGRLAGLNVLRIVNEPTAASLAYGLEKKRNGLIAVYDLGGGTFDVSILRLRDGIFEVLATHGDTQLGGDDFDQAIAQLILSTELSTYPQAGDLELRALLLDTAEKLKIELTDKPVAEAQVTIGGVNKKIQLSRDLLERLMLPLLQRTKAPVESALKDAGILASDLTDVVLVGGPTRIPFLRNYVAQLFNREPNSSLNPDEVVALGAAIQADILAGKNKDFLLLDVVPLTLGIETFGGTMSPLVERNTRIPTIAKEQFTTYVDGQTKVAINVYQGERGLVQDNRKLGEFVLHGIPPLPAGVARVEVSFLVDADGILNVSAKELYSNVEQSIEIRPTYGLTDAEVERMLEAGLLHAQDDAYSRKVVEAKNEAQVVLQATEKSLPLVENALTKEEIKEVEELIEQMRAALSSHSLDSINEAKAKLDQGTVHLAEVLMNQSLQTGMKNKKADDFLK